MYGYKPYSTLRVLNVCHVALAKQDDSITCTAAHQCVENLSQLDETHSAGSKSLSEGLKVGFEGGHGQTFVRA